MVEVIESTHSGQRGEARVRLAAEALGLQRVERFTSHVKGACFQPLLAHAASCYTPSAHGCCSCHVFLSASSMCNSTSTHNAKATHNVSTEIWMMFQVVSRGWYCTTDKQKRQI